MKSSPEELWDELKQAKGAQTVFSERTKARLGDFSEN